MLPISSTQAELEDLHTVKSAIPYQLPNRIREKAKILGNILSTSQCFVNSME